MVNPIRTLVKEIRDLCAGKPADAAGALGLILVGAFLLGGGVALVAWLSQGSDTKGFFPKAVLITVLSGALLVIGLFRFFVALVRNGLFCTLALYVMILTPFVYLVYSSLVDWLHRTR